MWDLPERGGYFERASYDGNDRGNSPSLSIAEVLAWEVT